MDEKMFNINTGEIRLVEMQDDYNLIPGYFWLIENENDPEGTQQLPVYNHNGEYIGMIFKGMYFNLDMIDELWYNE